MTKKHKKMLARLIISGILLFGGILFEKNMPMWLCWGVFVASYLAAGYDIPCRAVRNLFHGQVLDENFLMTIATFGAFAIGDLEEAVAVMLFYQVGELFSDYAVNRSRKSIKDLMDINPEYANLVSEDGEIQVDPYEVQIGDIIRIKPGEKVPLDGVIIKGSASLDTKALTGESMPAEVRAGEDIVSGSINLTGVLEVKVSKLFDDSTVAKILELVENASSRKAKAENFITKFARVYTPIVVGLAVLLALVPPLLGNYTALPLDGDIRVWLYRACSFLVVSCPCALVISVPLSFFGGLGAASKKGILMKGSNYLEALGHMDTVVFDKTGTLTTGRFQVTAVYPSGVSREELLRTAAYGEIYSNHPIALSVKEAYAQELDGTVMGEVEELPGRGVHAQIRGTEVYIGNRALMEEHGIRPDGEEGIIGTTLYAAQDGRYLGSIVISDRVREDVPAALKGLKAAGVRRLVMLTGDREAVGKEVGKQLGLDEVYGNLLPADKVAQVESLLKTKAQNGTLAFVGDGINDAPVLARADVGIAMGGIGSDAAVEAADVVIMNDEPSKLVDAIRISRKTVAIVRQNIIFAIAVKIIALVLVALGLASMWAAVFADVGVSVLAILNAVRALRD